MTKLIINADDFGYCEAVNYGIISAHNKGVVTSTTIMANMPGCEHGIKLLKENKTLDCGVHLTLSCYKPILNNLKTIVDENGYFYKGITNEKLEEMDLEEIYQEFCAQIDKVRKEIEISHLDSHHHVHTLKGLEEVIVRISNKYDLPIRGGFEYELDNIDKVDLIDYFYSKKVSEDFFEIYNEELNKYQIVDIMCHPAYLDNFIISSTSYSIERVKEHEILTSERVKSYLKNNFILTNYKNK